MLIAICVRRSFVIVLCRSFFLSDQRRPTRINRKPIRQSGRGEKWRLDKVLEV
uniref:Uncharacterized protein n=1 Tax=Ascaris lumbricoides TaxID=6252 RepID=A0A0M3IPY2_ASCLU